jgi:DNA-3-methyladenine glycosylase I
MRAYHDDEWGVPIHEDRRHFELLSLEGAQAGLSWRTVLAKRDAYREVFAGFDPRRVAEFDESDVERLVGDARIIRNRSKIESVISNARAFLELAPSSGDFDAYLWSFVGHRPVVGHFTEMAQVPASTPLSDEISRDLRRRGFRFVGPTIVYAHLQSAGLVLDHLTSCPRWTDLRGS